MNAVAQVFPVAKRQLLADWLERVGQELDLSDAQLADAREHYEAVGNWLGAGGHPWLKGSAIFAQGSIALGTAKVPVGHDEFDVDLVHHLHAVTVGASAVDVKRVVGERLRSHETYAEMLEEKRRCWRLNYSGAFHLDVTPSIPHPAADESTLLVPDRHLQRWLPSNPQGFRELFERRALLKPVFSGVSKGFDARASIEAFPLYRGPKGILRRLVQLLKHHRDVAFQDTGRSELRPISVIITALAARAYEDAIRARVYETDYDLLLAVVQSMPGYIEYRSEPGRVVLVVQNETVAGENFADKWNADQRLPEAFFAWHRQVVSDILALGELEGVDAIASHLNRAFGKGLGSRALAKMTGRVTAARDAGRLSYGRSGGSTAAIAAVTAVRRNTFYGRR